jgi:hypothetical protein
MTKSDISPLAHEASQEKPHEVDPELSLNLGGYRPDGHDQGRASQFDSAIDKERKVDQ